MKNLRNRLMGIALAVIAVFGLVFIVAGQDINFGLSEADFNAWTNANMISVTSATDLAYDFSTDTQIVAEGDVVDMNLTGDGVITADGFTMNVEGTISADGEEIPATLQLILVGDALYFNVGSGWVEATGEDLESTAGMAGIDPATLEDPTSALPMEALGGLANIDPTRYILMSRDGDTFNIDLLLEDLLSDPAVQEALMADPDTAQVAAMAPLFLTDSRFSAAQTLGANGMVESANLTIVAGSAEMGFSVNFTFDVNVAYGEGGTIEAPADTIPFEDFLNTMLGGV